MFTSRLGPVAKPLWKSASRCCESSTEGLHMRALAELHCMHALQIPPHGGCFIQMKLKSISLARLHGPISAMACMRQQPAVL